jgi:hypothetical protein
VDVLDLIDELGEKEEKINDLIFISPIFNSKIVVTDINQIIYKFSISTVSPGWHKFRPIDMKEARVVGSADMMERERYLKRLPKIRMTLVFRRGDIFLALPDKVNSININNNDLLPIYLFDDSVNIFDKIIARYDGAHFWFESVDYNNDPMKSEYLRESLEREIIPKDIKYPNLLIEEKRAYAIRFSFISKNKKERNEKNLIRDVEHAGGKYLRYEEKNDFYSITYEVDGEVYTSHISKKDDHMVISAGICLNGHDTNFDLKSIITVIKEAQEKDLIYRTIHNH